MVEHYHTAGQDEMIAHHSHLVKRVWSDQSNQNKGT